jgi:hypothetical protein
MGGVSPPAMIRVAHVMSGLDDLANGRSVASEVERSFRVVKAKVREFLFDPPTRGCANGEAEQNRSGSASHLSRKRVGV